MVLGGVYGFRPLMPEGRKNEAKDPEQQWDAWGGAPSQMLGRFGSTLCFPIEVQGGAPAANKF